MLRKLAVAGSLILSVGLPAQGQEWARKMFKVQSHDFGTVARGSKAVFEFEFSNLYLEDVHVASVRSSCGCTSVSVKDDQRLLKTYQKGAIVAAINSSSFLGQRGATITVTFDKPYYAEVQLHDSVYIRSDVNFEPGSVQLGSVEVGTPVERKIAVSCSGRSDWRIGEVRCANPHLTAQAVETGRSFGQVSYQLIVRLKDDAPVGYVHDHLMLVTNDSQRTQIPVAVEGRVLSSVTVSPTSLFLGVVKPGQKVTKQLVVKGSKPFRVLSIKCDEQGFEFDTSSAGEPKTLHLIPVTFVAGEEAGKITKLIRIETDLADGQPELSAFAVVSKP